MPKKNPFKNPTRGKPTIFSDPTEEQKQEREAKRLEALAQTKEATELAGKCLKLKAFNKYKQGFIKTEKNIIRLIKEYENPDPVQYAFAIQGLVMSLRNIEALLVVVEKDAKND